MTARIAADGNAWKLTGLVIWVARLSICVLCLLSGCDRGGTRGTLEGRWVGTVKTEDDWLLARVELRNTWNGLYGRMYLQGRGEWTLVRSYSKSDERVFEMRRGDEQFVIAARATHDEIVGHSDWGSERVNVHLRRLVQLDPRLVRSYLGTYGLGSDWIRSIEVCTAELGWDQLLYVDHRTGARKALFPISQNTFFFGPGFLIPLPIEGTVTFLDVQNGRPEQLLWEQAGAPARIAERISSDPQTEAKQIARRPGSARCPPFSG